jgi:hypothetical protein
MYPYYLSSTRSSPPLVLLRISTRNSSKALVLCSCLSTRPRSRPSSAPSYKVIDIHHYSQPYPSPITFLPILSSLALPQCYRAYSIMQSLLLPFNSHSSYVIVVDFKSHRLYALFVTIPSTPLHLLYFILQPT